MIVRRTHQRVSSSRAFRSSELKAWERERLPLSSAVENDIPGLIRLPNIQPFVYRITRARPLFE
jgi:hypothetical protein